MNEITLDCKDRLLKIVEAFKNELINLRTGRATPAMLDKVEVDYYGDKMPINQISSITCPEPRQLLIKPYDRGDVKSIVASINASDLGLNPINEGDSIRINIPLLNEDTRKVLVKKAKSISEEFKVSVRNIRREYIDLAKNSDELTEDFKKRVQEEIQKVVDEITKSIDEALSLKEKDIMAI